MLEKYSLLIMFHYSTKKLVTACFNKKKKKVFLIISETALYPSFDVGYIANQKGPLAVYHRFLRLFLSSRKIVLKSFKNIGEEKFVVP